MGTVDTRLIRHASEAGEWETVLRAPDPRLRPYVTRYAGWVERTTFVTRRELPSTAVVVIFSFRHGLKITHNVLGSETLRVQRAFVGGISDAYVTTASDGETAGLQVNFTPIGASLFFGMPMTEVANRSVELEDFIGPRAYRLLAQIEDTPDWETRFLLLEREILRRLAIAEAPLAGVAWAWRRLQSAGGNIAAGQLAEELGWSRRHFIERFKECVGLPPKMVGRVIRFERAVEMMNGGGQELADIAAECGYYDQAHFNRDFVAFAGSTPTEYLRRLLPDNGGFVIEYR